MRYSQKLLMALTAIICQGQALQAAPPITPEGTSEKILFTLDFSNPEIRTAIEKAGGVMVNEGPDGVPAARFDVAEGSDGKSKKMACFVLSAESLRGARVKVTSKVRGDAIHGPDTKFPLPGYLGGKVQVYIDAPSRGKRYLDARSLHDTFPWKDVGVLGGIMDDANEVQIRIGLEGASGTFWVSELTMVLVQAKAIRAKAVSQAPKQQTTQKRGFMSSNNFHAEDFTDMWALHVNVVRWQMGQQPADQRAYETWLDGELDDLALALDAAAANGIQLVVDLHTAPGGRLPDRTYRMYMEQTYRDMFVQTWKRIAIRFKGHPGLWAYDLANEPVQNYPSPAGMPDWLGLQVEAGKAIRAIDPDTAIVIEVDQWDSPDSFAWLEPVDLSNVIYQAHMYWPWEFTHQGIKTNQGGADGKDFDKHSLTYPGTLDNRPLDKEALRRYLAPVREFQLAYDARIFIGEFSAVRWAPGAAQYLDDTISIFEEYGWDWTYHAFRESPLWSVEHDNLPYNTKKHTRASAPTDRLQVLQKWFDRNVRPEEPEAQAVIQSAGANPAIYRRVLFVGNSITKSAPQVEKLGWAGNWGMAASAEEKDYVHLFLSRLAKEQGGTMPEFLVAGGRGGKIPGKVAVKQQLTDFKADLAIVQLGENDAENVTVEGFQKPYEELLQAIRAGNPDARLICMGVWSPPRGNPTKDKFIKAACENYGATFADMSAANPVPENKAEAEKRFIHQGVNWHPGDQGMEAYSRAIWTALTGARD